MKRGSRNAECGIGTLLAVTPQEVLSAGRDLGTASNQVILGTLLVVLIFCIAALAFVIAWLHRDNKKSMTAFIDKMEQKESAMTAERKDRISSLMGLLERDIAVQEKVKNAIDNNTSTIARFETLLTKLIGTRFS